VSSICCLPLSFSKSFFIARKEENLDGKVRKQKPQMETHRHGEKHEQKKDRRLYNDLDGMERKQVTKFRGVE
jgi:hypothetical protein